MLLLADAISTAKGFVGRPLLRLPDLHPRLHHHVLGAAALQHDAEPDPAVPLRRRQPVPRGSSALHPAANLGGLGLDLSPIVAIIVLSIVHSADPARLERPVGDRRPAAKRPRDVPYPCRDPPCPDRSSAARLRAPERRSPARRHRVELRGRLARPGRLARRDRAARDRAGPPARDRGGPPKHAPVRRADGRRTARTGPSRGRPDRGGGAAKAREIAASAEADEQRVRDEIRRLRGLETDVRAEFRAFLASAMERLEGEPAGVRAQPEPIA